MTGVYKPSEDTLFLIDALKEIEERLGTAVEVGSGTGEVTKALSQLSEETHATDISFKAARITAEALKKTGVWNRCHVVCCDLLSAYRSAEIFDLIVSNPPYLEPENLGDSSIEGGWRFLIRLFEQAAERIRLGGRVLLVVSSQTRNLREVLRRARELGFSTIFARRTRLFFEELKILEATYRGRRSP